MAFPPPPPKASGSVTKVESTTGELTVATPTTTPDLSITKVPAAALTAGTGTAIATVTGKASLSAPTAKGGTVTALSSTTGELTIATPTTTPDLSITKVPAAALTAGTGAAIATVTGKASLSVTEAPKINTTAITGNATAATQVLIATAANAAHWGAAPAGALTSASVFIAATVALTANVAKNITSLSLAAGTWLVIAQANISMKSGSRSIALTKTTASMATALASASTFILPATDTLVAMLVCSCIVTLAATTTIYLNAEASMAGNVLAFGAPATTHNLTGINAVRIG